MRSPPLNALRFFEAAARLASFRRAAKELCVTEAAVSRQIKLLESRLEVELFHRGDRRVTLTEAGQQLFPVVREIFVSLSTTIAEIVAQRQVLRLYSTTSFALGWLLQRLSDFERHDPSIKVSLETGTTPELNHFASDRLDACIIYLLDSPAETDNRIIRIVDELVIPVCAPGFLPGGRRIPPSEFSKHRLLYNEPTGRDWRRWFARAEANQVNKEYPIRLDSDNAAIQASIAGHGIALANLIFVSSHLRSGCLVPASDIAPVSIGAHFLFCPTAKAFELHRVAAFRQWLEDEIYRDLESIFPMYFKPHASAIPVNTPVLYMGRSS